MLCFKSPLVIFKHILSEMSGTFEASKIGLFLEVFWFGLVFTYWEGRSRYATERILGQTHPHNNLLPPETVLCLTLRESEGFPRDSVVKNLPANTGDAGLIPGLGRSSGEGNGNPLQYSYLGNSVDRGAWQSKVHEVTKSWT